jgi:conserved oligomeric Golgi complex subunit 3
MVSDLYFQNRACLDELQASKSHLNTLLADTSSTLELLSSLSESFNSVELQTSTFQKQCEKLLSAQKLNSDLADHISGNLQYYDFLDPASRKLNAPGAGSTVRSREFSDMLRRLDECLDYMEAHVRFYFHRLLY